MAESKGTDSINPSHSQRNPHVGASARSQNETDGVKTLTLGPESTPKLSTVGGRFEIRREIGRGGIGVAYVATDKLNQDRPVVVKALLSQPEVKEKEWVERHFAEEVKALSRIDHPGVVKFIASGDMSDGRPFIAMEFVEGYTLRSQIESEVGLGDLRRIADIFRELASAISAAHDMGVYHRDLKPENIMLFRQQVGDTEVEHAKVIDFGISIVKDKFDEKTRSTQLAGSVRYMAPEQLEGKPSRSSDIYALGLIAFEMLTGRLPFNPDADSGIKAARQLIEMQRAGIRVRPRDLRPSLPVAAQDSILRALSYSPIDRYQRADQFGQELALALTQADEPEDADQRGTYSSSSLEMAYVLFIEIIDHSTLPVDLQTGCLKQLQTAIRGTKAFRKAESQNRLICMPVTEGMALAFFGDPTAAASCAVELSSALKEHPKIGFRMGVHAGPVYSFPDINANRSLAGSGINAARKVMECGDAGHILVSQNIADVLLQLSEWKSRLHDLGTHPVMTGMEFGLFSLFTDEAGNREVPTRILQSGETTGKTKTSAQGKSKPNRLRLAAISVALLAVFVVTGIYLIKSRFGSGPAPAVLPAIHTLRFWAEAQSYRGNKKEGDPVRLVGSEAYFTRGDGIRFVFTSLDDGNLYLIHESLRDHTYALLFPSPAAPDSRINANARVATSENEFDEQTGTERVWIIWSVRPIPEMEEAAVQWANVEHQGKIKDAGQTAFVKNLLEESTANKPDVSVDLANRQIVVMGKGEQMIYLLQLQHR
jgi:serine/threonine protein kinase